jgi:hypothetical protein
MMRMRREWYLLRWFVPIPEAVFAYRTIAHGGHPARPPFFCSSNLARVEQIGRVLVEASINCSSSSRNAADRMFDPPDGSKWVNVLGAQRMPNRKPSAKLLNAELAEAGRYSDSNGPNVYVTSGVKLACIPMVIRLISPQNQNIGIDFHIPT